MKGGLDPFLLVYFARGCDVKSSGIVPNQKKQDRVLVIHPDIRSCHQYRMKNSAWLEKSSLSMIFTLIVLSNNLLLLRPRSSHNLCRLWMLLMPC